jgi:hypothetical protein
MGNFGQLAGEKSLVPKRSEISRNLPALSMGDFKSVIWQFESFQGSQPVRSLWVMYGSQKFARHFRELLR